MTYLGPVTKEEEVFDFARFSQAVSVVIEGEELQETKQGLDLHH